MKIELIQSVCTFFFDIKEECKHAIKLANEYITLVPKAHQNDPRVNSFKQQITKWEFTLKCSLIDNDEDVSSFDDAVSLVSAWVSQTTSIKKFKKEPASFAQI